MISSTKCDFFSDGRGRNFLWPTNKQRTTDESHWFAFLGSQWNTEQLCRPQFDGSPHHRHIKDVKHVDLVTFSSLVIPFLDDEGGQQREQDNQRKYFWIQVPGVDQRIQMNLRLHGPSIIDVDADKTQIAPSTSEVRSGLIRLQETVIRDTALVKNVRPQIQIVEREKFQRASRWRQ